MIMIIVPDDSTPYFVSGHDFIKRNIKARYGQIAWSSTDPALNQAAC